MRVMERKDVAATIAQLARGAGHAVEQWHEALVFTTPAIDTAHVARWKSSRRMHGAETGALSCRDDAPDRSEGDIPF